MASVFCIGVPKTSATGYLTRLCKVPKNHNVIHVAFMKRLSLKDPFKRAYIFRYWEKQYSLIQKLITFPTLYYDDNTKLIVVDGPPAVGKSKLCEALAKEFGLLYMPAPTHDEIYINPYGEDLRQLDDKLPFHCKSYDMNNFLANPKDLRVAHFQIMFLSMRFEQYANALLHLLSTGQGVVLNRSIYSDLAFTEAMLKSGFISDHVMSEYMYMRQALITQLLRPHLIIYLDVPPELVKEKINKRGNPVEVNSKVFTTKYLSDLENAYKKKCLKPLQNHAQLLIYDWSKEGDVQDICHDIENLDLTVIEDVQFKDWVFFTVPDIQQCIEVYQDKWIIYRSMFENMEIPPRELYWTAEESEALNDVLKTLPGEKYDYEFNPKSKDNMFTERKPILHLLRRTPRDFINRDESLF